MRPGALTAVWLVAGCGRLGFDDVALQPCDTLALTPATLATNVSTHTPFAASGGNPPYAFTLTGDGAIDDRTGRYASPAHDGTATITVSDIAGCTASATITVGGDSLWFLGGQNNVLALDPVYRSLDGSTWTQASTLPTPRARGGVVVFEDRLWYLGGGDDATSHDDVLATRDGVMWTKVGTLPRPIVDTYAAVYRDELWLVGGHGDPGAVLHSPDGVTWTRAGMLPFPAHGGVLRVVADRLLYYGGHDDTKYYDTIYASTDGATWTQVGTLPQQIEFQGMAEVRGELWLAGGIGSTSSNSVLTSTDGSSWVPRGTLPAKRAYGSMAVLAGKMWFIGGDDGGQPWSAAAPDAWTVEGTNLPLPRLYTAIASFRPHP